MNSANIAVVGGGIFGCTAAHILARAGHRVTLFEQKSDIMLCASYTNQRRLHRGYHYPRSPETVLSLRKSIENFKREYADAVYTSHESLYCIAREGSYVSAEEYIKFCNEHELPINVISMHPLINHRMVDLTVGVEEQLFDFTTLKNIVCQKMYDSGVNVKIAKRFSAESGSAFDIVVNATYSNLNELTVESEKKNYQFEICEKISVIPPRELQNRSIVVLDGPFCCIDPLGKNVILSQLGHVIHAVRSVNIGHKCDNVEKFSVDKGLNVDKSISKFDNFIESLSDFVPSAATCQYIGSQYTIRAVQPYVDDTDQRPTIVEWVSDKQVNLFSGKIDTCVNAAELILEEL